MTKEQMLEYRQKLSDKSYMNNAISKIVETGVIFENKLKNKTREKKAREMFSVQELNNIMARNIIYYRKLKNITAEKLAEMMNISVNNISDWERGAKFIRANNIVYLAYLLDIEVWQLYYPGKFKSTQKIKSDLQDIKEQLKEIQDCLS